MRYADAKRLVRASKTLEGVDPLAIADVLTHACGKGAPDHDDVATAAAAAFELAKLGASRPLFWGMIR